MALFDYPWPKDKEPSDKYNVRCRCLNCDNSFLVWALKGIPIREGVGADTLWIGSQPGTSKLVQCPKCECTRNIKQFGK